MRFDGLGVGLVGGTEMMTMILCFIYFDFRNQPLNAGQCGGRATMETCAVIDYSLFTEERGSDLDNWGPLDEDKDSISFLL